MIKNWETKTLGEICNFVGGGTPSKNNPDFWNGDIPWASIKDIKGQYLNKTSDHITDKGLKESATNLAYPNEIILATRINPGKPIITKILTSINQDLKIVRPKIEIDNGFLYYLFLNIENDIIKLSNGTTVLGITLNSLNEINLKLPPLQTQQAIVSKIEELFSELDKGIEDLKTAQQQLKTYRQSVLKWAFEGKLTNKNVKDGELPEGWKIKTLGELGKWKGGGTPSKQNKSFWESGTNLWVSSKDMKFKNINDSIDKITDEAIIKSSAKIISKGAILFVMRSGILRHTLPVAIAGKDLTVNQDLQSVEPYDYIDSEYLYWFIIGQNQKIRQECSKDGTTVESIDTKRLKNYPIQIAPLEEQDLIVQEIESRLSVADKMEESIAQSLQQAEALRQSILKRAFSGELV